MKRVIVTLLLLAAVLSQSNSVKFFDYQSCAQNTCVHIVCDEFDFSCINEQQNYNVCVAKQTSCKNWDRALPQTDSLQAQFYECQNECRPNQERSGSFWDKYTCNYMCAGQQIPSYYQYQTCVYIRATCPAGTDYDECVGDKQLFDNCLKERYETVFNVKSSYGLTSDFLSVLQQCM